MVETGRAMAVDHGTRRIGVAITDPLRMIARPLCVVELGGAGEESEAGQREALARLVALVNEWGVLDVVVGIPYLASGDIGPSAQRCLSFASELERALADAGCAARVGTFDESHTTQDAAGRLAAAGGDRGGRAGGRRRSFRRSRGAANVGVDAVAAAVLLTQWLAVQTEFGSGAGSPTRASAEAGSDAGERGLAT